MAGSSGGASGSGLGLQSAPTMGKADVHARSQPCVFSLSPVGHREPLAAAVKRVATGTGARCVLLCLLVPWVPAPWFCGRLPRVNGVCVV